MPLSLHERIPIGPGDNDLTIARVLIDLAIAIVWHSGDDAAVALPSLRTE
jgi:hypothetical protein